jgi:putative oxygen-independent coproporphyrinogen III oxidase
MPSQANLDGDPAGAPGGRPGLHDPGASGRSTVPDLLDPVRTGAAHDASFGLYVHWPFCRAKCPYCDFNSHVSGAVDHDRWSRALLRELDHFALETAGRTLTSIFFGGGTPSLMAPATVAAVIDRAAAHFRFESQLEITLEANPTSADAGRLADFHAAGISRLSLGVQALDDRALRALGREHSAAEALAAVDAAARLFPRLSFDLIYARPGQTLAAWKTELERALGHVGGHLSVYQLTIEPGTPFHARHLRGELELPPDGQQAAMYEFTQERLAAAGLPAYEISNHARPDEACRHNLGYWRCSDYIGIGPGAHGRLSLADGRFGTETLRVPKAWLEQVERAGHAERPREALGREDQTIELLLMGLRLTAGVSLDRLASIAGEALDRLVDHRSLEQFVADGLLANAQGRLIATPSGRQRLNSILSALLRTPQLA